MDIEQQALDMGWLPLEKFKGNPERWTEADEYVRRGEDLLPIVKASEKRLREELKKKDEDLRLALKVQKAELEEMKKQGYAQAEADYEVKKKKLDAKEKEAFENQDEAAFNEVKKEREELKPPKQEEQKPIPEFVEWNKKNDWYGKDPFLTKRADAEVGIILEEKGQLSPTELYAEVEKNIRAVFPDKFENPNRNGPGEVESNSAPEPVKVGGFDDLPSEAKSAYERQKAMQKEKGRDFTKKQFLEFYNEA